MKILHVLKASDANACMDNNQCVSPEHEIEQLVKSIKDKQY